MKKFFTAIFKFFALAAVFFTAWILLPFILVFIPINLSVFSFDVTALLLAVVVTIITNKLVFAK